MFFASLHFLNIPKIYTIHCSLVETTNSISKNHLTFAFVNTGLGLHWVLTCDRQFFSATEQFNSHLFVYSSFTKCMCLHYNLE